MGVRNILNKRGYSGICLKNGWHFGVQEDLEDLKSMLTSSLFTVKSSSRGKHTLKDVIRGTFRLVCQGSKSCNEFDEFRFRGRTPDSRYA